MNNEHYSYYTKFKISSEHHLDDFWSFVITKLNIQHDKVIYDRFSRLYHLLLEHKAEFHTPITLFLYENSEEFIIKVKSNIHALTEKLSCRLQTRNYSFERGKNCLAYSIEKVKDDKQGVVKSCSVNNKIELTIYEFIREDDLYELTNIIEKVQLRDYEKIDLSLTHTELNDYKTSFSYFASILQGYTQLVAVSNVIAETAVILSLYARECLEFPNESRAFLKGMMNSLDSWIHMLFIDGCERFDFMDASFVADLAQYKILLNLYDDEDMDCDASLDDIFDF